MNGQLRWGILGTGRIAHTFAAALGETDTGVLTAVASRRQADADRFGDEFAVPSRHGSYESLLADPEVDAVYIAPPHPLHAEWAIRAAEAGKHILCEKPLTLNHPTSMAVVQAAQRNDVFLMEAFMYRCHPQTQRLVDLIRDGAIGQVRLIEATFSFRAPSAPGSRLYSSALGGGGILDVGGYCTSMARLIAGAASGAAASADPIEVHAAGHLGETGVDEYAAALLTFPGDIIARVSTGVAVNQENVVRVYGTEGDILLPSPWFAGGERESVLHVTRAGQTQVVTEQHAKSAYAFEADVVARSIEARQAPWPAMTLADSLGNMRTLDRWRHAIGLEYPQEQLQHQTAPTSGRPLRRRHGSTMPYGRIDGVEKPVSRLAMGTMIEDAELPAVQGPVLFDGFFEAGGTCFDTAHLYRGGQSEEVFGQWMRSRGVRDDVVVLGKGAATPYCDPENLTRQLLLSLERMQTDYVDLYMMHRDNEAIPVGEFVDVLNEHRQAGRMRAFGVSNWSLARVEEANRYAAAHGLTGFAALSNNFSLARLVEPIWPGSIATNDAKSRAWFTRTQTPLFPWSSQARGFFANGSRDDTSDPELVRCWYSDDNFERLDRVRVLAEQRGVRPITIALAYVLAQPFPTFPLIGPRSLHELETSLPALGVELTPDEVAWLNLEG
ncbi:aldo/keto reductase [Amnibacterium sp. CER49]|uniref:aldo/keto reductase n=1 Tax=Amnibacterium sp. CER49 TaxID=3039161 RepID=UPI0024495C1B|nr:aldo/keto reductase [Amnibacterium sp. CER49]MDH2444898.1 aldo/keto reductase [Amnibacterium sp. CER49]